MRAINYILLAILSLPAACFAQSNNFNLNEASFGLPHLYGKRVNAGYPYVTAGDRIYAIGDQAGGFPAIGFHVEGQMGGVWMQPIKLLNGYTLTIKDARSDFSRVLNTCDSFVTGNFTSRFLHHFFKQQLSVTRTEFVPDGTPVLVVEYDFTNNGKTDKDLTLDLNADVNLMPVWLGERSGLIDSTDEVLGWEKGNVLLFKDCGNSWYAGIGFEAAKGFATGNGIAAQNGYGTGKISCSGALLSAYKGKGIATTLTTLLHIPAGRHATFRFYVSGSMKNKTELFENIERVKSNLAALFAAKRERYNELDRMAAIEIPDKALQQAYRWGKYSSDWLVREVPGMGRGMSAGLPDYPWFFSNDQAYTFNARVGTIMPDLFYDSWKMMQRISDSVNDHSGRIIHEVSTNGSVYDKGRMEESQLFIISAWNIFKWTGNLDFLKTYYEHGARVWKWLQQHDTDRNSYIEGYGGVEIEGLNAEMLDVQVRTRDFLRVMGEMAETLQDPVASVDYLKHGDALGKKINEDWWMPSESRYADFISSRSKALSIIDSAIVKRTSPSRNDWAVKKLDSLRSAIINNQYADKGYTVYYNTAGILPLEDGMADTSRAMQMLSHISFFTNKYGMYITGIERPDDVRIDEGSFRKDKEFNYGRAVMPAATGGLVVAACRYGQPDTALKYIHRILNSFGYATPGTTYEVSPDYGMFVQAWNIRGLNIPLIHYFFGIDPMASEKRISIRPGMPGSWDHASISNVLIGSNRLSMAYRKKDKTVSYTFHSTQDGWTIDLVLPAGVSAVRVNGKPAVAGDIRKDGIVVKDGDVVNERNVINDGDVRHIRLSGKENSVNFISK